MADVLNIAVQCDSFYKIIALIVIIIFLVVITIIGGKYIIKLVGMVLSTIKHYHNASVKLKCGDSVNAELDLHK